MTSTHVRVAARAGKHGPASQDPVLLSKITEPRMPGWAVPRPRLDALIARGIQGPLTVVTGPPGAGKTMAITSWAAASTEPCILAWIALDEYDNRPQVFWSYVAAALRRAGLTVPRMGSAASGEASVSHLFLLRLAAALASQGQPVVMVIEDFHLLSDGETLDGLSYVLRNAGPGLRLVISSRVQPLLPLHRYRLNGELTEIRAEHLAFSVAESGLLMAQLGVTLSQDALERLTARTEGWAAGIRLAGISLDGHPDPEQFVKNLGSEDSAITGYLVEEVLNAQPPAVRDFLLRTSILDRVNSGSAADLTGNEQAADLLPGLAATNAFVRPLGGGWYRYHPLFAEILRLKLRRQFPAELPDLHRRAAGWCLRSGRLVQAVRHAGSAGDWQLAARMVLDELAIGQLIDPRGSQALADEFRHMPVNPAGATPELLLITAALDLSAGGESTGIHALAAAEGILGSLPAEDALPARIAAALIRIAICRHAGDLEAATAYAVTAESLLTAIPPDSLTPHPAIQGHILLHRGIVELWRGDPDPADAAVAAALAASVSPDGWRDRTEYLGQLALAEALRGRLNSAVRLASDATATDQDAPEAAAPAANVALACVHVQRHELRQAHGELARADAALRQCPDKFMGAVASLIAAQCRLAEGRASALELVSRARQGWSPPRWLGSRLTLLEARAHAAAGDAVAAANAARRAGPQSAADVSVALAHALLTAGDHHGARSAAPLLPAGPGTTQGPASIERWLMEARLSYGDRDAQRGRRALERAFQLAGPEQIRLPFAMERTWLQPVLARDPGLARAHRELFEPEPAATRTAALARPAAVTQAPALVVDQLSEREREVLCRLSGMLTTAEIAAEMYISVNTVKTHLKSIYRKLAADHRGEAVRRARQLKLI